jgi:(p)ppGpp synthase/HD superfamily hydrolase
MSLIEKSLHIALRAYAGKTDKAGREYILHPLRVMAKMSTDLERSAALLHDVIEDSDITARELLAEGIPAPARRVCLTAML